MKRILSEFYIYHDKFQDLSNKAIDWYIKSWKYKIDSDERTICRLKRNIYMREALSCLKKANRSYV